MDFVFLLSSVLLGAGLAMDAFSVSLANGFHEPGMGWKKISFMAGIFAFFQWLMPMAGWICVHIIVEVFQFFASYIPWIACFLLCFIGVSMVKEGFSGDAGHIRAGVGKKALLLQGVATSIDALSVGFTNEQIDQIHDAYRLLYGEGTREENIQKIKETLPMTEEIQHIIEFVQASSRGIIK